MSFPTVAAKIESLLTAAYAGPNTGLPASDRISTYRSVIPGIPTFRYALIYCGEPRRGNSTVDGLSRDANGRFQVTVAASRPNTAATPDGELGWLVKTTLDALVDITVTDVDGLAQFTIQQDEVDTYPVAVEVVADRVTVEQALLFVYLADRI